ncbi:hypothetical protein MPQ_2065 [Methylovorus sp. MP688]|nr:hypothetical protein MPQ_2065 [Methylovorus sp. MP688]
MKIGSASIPPFYTAAILPRSNFSGAFAATEAEDGLHKHPESYCIDMHGWLDSATPPHAALL